MSLVLNEGPSLDVLLTVQYRFNQVLAEPWVIAKYSAQEGRLLPTTDTVGWRKREQVINQRPDTGGNRVLFLPGHGLGDSRSHGKLTLGPNLSTGNARATNPRVEWRWFRKFTVSVWSYDPCDATNEVKQLNAATDLLEFTVGALSATLGAAIRGGEEITQDKFSINLPFGIEYLVPMSVDSRLFGLPRDTITEVTPVVNKTLPTE
jgi:hypothetical protein